MGKWEQEKVESLLIRKWKNLDLTGVTYIASSFSTSPQTQYYFTGLKAIQPWRGGSGHSDVGGAFYRARTWQWENDGYVLNHSYVVQIY